MRDESMLAVLIVVYLPINFGLLNLDWERVSRLSFLKKIFWIATYILVGIFFAGGCMIVCIWNDMCESRA